MADNLYDLGITELKKIAKEEGIPRYSTYTLGTKDALASEIRRYRRIRVRQEPEGFVKSPVTVETSVQSLTPIAQTVAPASVPNLISFTPTVVPVSVQKTVSDESEGDNIIETASTSEGRKALRQGMIFLAENFYQRVENEVNTKFNPRVYERFFPSNYSLKDFIRLQEETVDKMSNEEIGALIFVFLEGRPSIVDEITLKTIIDSRGPIYIPRNGKGEDIPTLFFLSHDY